MKINALLLAIALLAVAGVASAQDAFGHRGGGGGYGGGCDRPCTPEPVSMIGLGIAGLGILRAKLKKQA